jgi:cysteine synthase A
LELTDSLAPNGCRVLAKAEYQNPTGSHYDREMIEFLYALEQDRVITPGETVMLETTTGNSGASFAWLCRALGFPAPSIIIPEDMPYARKQQIAAFGADIIPSPAEEYITGISETFVQERKKWAGYIPAHWEDVTCSVTAMEKCADEVNEAIDDRFDGTLDYFFLALGNGSSARGIGQVFKSLKPQIKLIGVEPAESPIVAEWLNHNYPGRAAELGLAEFATRREGDRKHGIIGTGPSEEHQIYPNMQAAALLLDDIAHVTTSEARSMQIRLMDEACLHVGMSSAACLRAIHEYVRANDIQDKTIATVFYDPAWKYL